MRNKRIPQLLFLALSISLLSLTIIFYRSQGPASENIPKGPRYVFLAPNNKETFWCSIAAGAKAADQKFQTDTLLVEYSNAKDIRSYFEEALLTEADGIIMKGTNKINEEIREAADLEIPVVFYDSDIPQSGRSCYIGVNNYETGRKAAQVLINGLQKSGKILAIVRSKSAFSQEDRVAALEEELHNYPDIEIVDYIEDSGDALLLKQNLLQAVKQYQDLDAILCMEETASNHVGNLLRENSINPQNYYIVSLDFTKQTAQYLEDNTYDVVVMYDTRQIGYQAVKFLAQEQTAPTEKGTIYLDNIVITKDNVKEYKDWHEEITLEWNSY